MNYTAYPVRDDRPTRWYDLKGAWVIYVLLVAVLRILLGEFLSASQAWTATSLIHAGVSWLLLHWEKGATFPVFDQGKLNTMTIWEQLDHEVQYTPTRKFLTLVPIVLFLIATYFSDFETPALYINILALGVLLISKLSRMHMVRLFGINR